MVFLIVSIFISCLSASDVDEYLIECSGNGLNLYRCSQKWILSTDWEVATWNDFLLVKRRKLLNPAKLCDIVEKDNFISLLQSELPIESFWKLRYQCWIGQLGITNFTVAWSWKYFSFHSNVNALRKLFFHFEWIWYWLQISDFMLFCSYIYTRQITVIYSIINMLCDFFLNVYILRIRYFLLIPLLFWY